MNQKLARKLKDDSVAYMSHHSTQQKHIKQMRDLQARQPKQIQLNHDVDVGGHDSARVSPEPHDDQINTGVEAPSKAVMDPVDYLRFKTATTSSQNNRKRLIKKISSRDRGTL